ncbi:carbohydrate ABC transporter permease [Sporolactobacillus kofuensis]|uniref:Carbohydrate ABC transporter permease n=1 Tax=Sporolactobacillus kofuensis TaxID=269672 RepID=A0ABW1WC18_9BACL|nr:sugar ABC transporter permease [Sporolactobacillus kofuensis]MCO7174840.1 sugar ABC transporter permease [Sporolactobacillus kofuensis]
MKTFLNKNSPYLFITPALFLLLIFSIVPIIISLIISFTDINITGLADWSKIHFIGLSNYVNLFNDPAFLQSIGNSIFYVVIGVPFVIACSMGIALLINFGDSWIFRLFRLIFYAPSITNVVAVAVVWNYLYNPQFGLLNYMLQFVHLGPVPWLQDPFIAKISLIILALWRAIGVNMLIFLAALQGIPKAYYEAAQIDGANSWQRLTKITIPMLRFATFFVTVTTLIGWLQFFEEPLVMTSGGPLNSTNSIALFIYQNGFQFSKFGYAAAGSMILFVIIIVVTLIQFRGQRKQQDNQM